MSSPSYFMASKTSSVDRATRRQKPEIDQRRLVSVAQLRMTRTARSVLDDATSNPFFQKVRGRWLSTQMFANIPARTILSMRRLRS